MPSALYRLKKFIPLPLKSFCTVSQIDKLRSGTVSHI